MFAARVLVIIAVIPTSVDLAECRVPEWPAALPLLLLMDGGH